MWKVESQPPWQRQRSGPQTACCIPVRHAVVLSRSRQETCVCWLCIVSAQWRWQDETRTKVSVQKQEGPDDVWWLGAAENKCKESKLQLSRLRLHVVIKYVSQHQCHPSMWSRGFQQGVCNPQEVIGTAAGGHGILGRLHNLYIFCIHVYNRNVTIYTLHYYTFSFYPQRLIIWVSQQSGYGKHKKYINNK